MWGANVWVLVCVRTSIVHVGMGNLKYIVRSHDRIIPYTAILFQFCTQQWISTNANAPAENNICRSSVWLYSCMVFAEERRPKYDGILFTITSYVSEDTTTAALPRIGKWRKNTHETWNSIRHKWQHCLTKVSTQQTNESSIVLIVFWYLENWLSNWDDIQFVLLVAGNYKFVTTPIIIYVNYR